jgi:hypothetical protein
MADGFSECKHNVSVTYIPSIWQKTCGLSLSTEFKWAIFSFSQFSTPHAGVTEPRPTPQLIIENADSMDSQMNCFCPCCLQGPSNIMTSHGLNYKARHCALPFMTQALLRERDSFSRSEQIPTVCEMSYLNIELE